MAKRCHTLPAFPVSHFPEPFNHSHAHPFVRSSGVQNNNEQYKITNTRSHTHRRSDAQMRPTTDLTGRPVSWPLRPAIADVAISIRSNCKFIYLAERFICCLSAHFFQSYFILFFFSLFCFYQFYLLVIYCKCVSVLVCVLVLNALFYWQVCQCSSAYVWMYVANCRLPSASLDLFNFLLLRVFIEYHLLSVMQFILMQVCALFCLCVFVYVFMCVRRYLFVPFFPRI